MNDKDDSAWVFDSLIGFLQGPIWSAPLLTFIEEKSLIFEADAEDCEEYRKVYQEYKNLVDLLLGCFMEDMGITPEQFEHACSVNKNTKMPIQFQQSLFEQIWAANEYEIFKRMMIQKNLELQLQALNMIEQKYGLTPASLMYETENSQEEELAMEELMNKHILEGENEKILPVETALVEEHERLTTEYRNERTLLEEALKVSTRSSRSTSPESESNVVKKTEILQELKKLRPLSPIPSAKVEKTSDNASEEDIKKRQQYLKARRDELIAMKKEVRSQRLEMNTSRPSSARAIADAAIKGKQELDVNQTVEPSILQIRRALAARLKAEVVQK